MRAIDSVRFKRAKIIERPVDGLRGSLLAGRQEGQCGEHVARASFLGS